MKIEVKAIRVATALAIAAAVFTSSCVSNAAPANQLAVSGAGTETLELVVGRPSAGQVEGYTYPALGGVRIAVSAEYRLYAQGDRVMIHPSVDMFQRGVAYIGLATQGPFGNRLKTVEQFGQLAGVQFDANGTYVQLFGYDLVGYTTSPEDALTTGDIDNILPSTRIGAGAPHEWTPRDDEIFLAETPAGVLYIGYSRSGATTDAVALPAFLEVLASAELTGPGLTKPLPDGAVPRGSAQAPSASFTEAGPRPLLVTFNDVRPAEYELSNFAAPISLTVPHGWVARMNRPGAVVLVRNRSAGLGDEEIHFAVGVEQHLVAQAGGPSASSESVDLTDFEGFLTDPPDNLSITNIARINLAGLPATSFDVRISDHVSCAQDTPCEYTFEMKWDWAFPPTIRAESFHRVWWLEGHPGGPAVIVAVDNGPTSFLDAATELVESMEAVG